MGALNKLERRRSRPAGCDPTPSVLQALHLPELSDRWSVAGRLVIPGALPGLSPSAGAHAMCVPRASKGASPPAPRGRCWWVRPRVAPAVKAAACRGRAPRTASAAGGASSAAPPPQTGPWEQAELGTGRRADMTQTAASTVPGSSSHALGKFDRQLT